NGVWNSKWERSNPFGPAATATKAVFTKLYHACNNMEYSRAALLLTQLHCCVRCRPKLAAPGGPIVLNIADHFADRPDFQRFVAARLEQRHQVVLGFGYSFNLLNRRSNWN